MFSWSNDLLKNNWRWEVNSVVVIAAEQMHIVFLCVYVLI